MTHPGELLCFSAEKERKTASFFWSNDDFVNKHTKATALPSPQSPRLWNTSSPVLMANIALRWALHTTTERPVYYVGFELIAGSELFFEGINKKGDAHNYDSSTWQPLFVRTRDEVTENVRRFDI
eukprot:6213299-Pleurochrysis_carterae.AAC.2